MIQVFGKAIHSPLVSNSKIAYSLIDLIRGRIPIAVSTTYSSVLRIETDAV